jgi:hypothetical protein
MNPAATEVIEVEVTLPEIPLLVGPEDNAPNTQEIQQYLAGTIHFIQHTIICKLLMIPDLLIYFIRLTELLIHLKP